MTLSIVIGDWWNEGTRNSDSEDVMGAGYILPSDTKMKMTVEQIKGEARLSGSCRLGQSMSRVLTQMQVSLGV